jgi:sporulation protein YlmC with PRC-barrel domain
MLRNLNDMLKCSLYASDGEVGDIRDFYFDDKSWAIRYLIVETGHWLATKKVLISPIAVHHVDFEKHQILVQQTKEKIRHSPDVDTELPVSRQHEVMFNGYYGYPFYWGGEGLWGAATYPSMLMPMYTGSLTTPHHASDESVADAHGASAGHDHHLRSMHEIAKYQVDVKGEIIGRVKSMLIDEMDWSVRYLIVDTQHWWPSHEILIEMQHILEVSWETESITVNLSPQAIKDAPHYDSSKLYTLDNELALRKHYEVQGFGLDL